MTNNKEQILEYIQQTQEIIKSAKELAYQETERKGHLKKYAEEVVQKLIQTNLLDKDNAKLAEQALQNEQGWFDLALNLIEHVQAATKKAATHADLPLGTVDQPSKAESTDFGRGDGQYARVVGDIDYRLTAANRTLTERIMADIRGSHF